MNALKTEVVGKRFPNEESDEVITPEGAGSTFSGVITSSPHHARR
jgi:hypothetical protein